MSVVIKKKDTLFNLLNDYYQSIGLEMNKKRSTFSDSSRKIYWYPCYKTSKKIVYQLHLSLKFPAVQIIQDKLFPESANFTVHRKAGKPLKHELGIKEKYLFNDKFLIEDRSLFYVITEGVDTNPSEIVDDHIQFMNKIGLKFFDLLGSVNLIDNFINNYPLSQPASLLSENVILSIRKNKLTQEAHAGLIAANLIDRNRGIKLAEAYLVIYPQNESFINGVKKITAYFNQID